MGFYFTLQFNSDQLLEWSLWVGTPCIYCIWVYWVVAICIWIPWHTHLGLVGVNYRPPLSRGPWDRFVGTGLASHQTHWTQSKQPGSGKKLVLKWPKRLSHISHGASHLAVTYLLVLWRLNGFFLWARFTALCYSTEVQSLQSDKDYLVMYYRMY